MGRISADHTYRAVVAQLEDRIILVRRLLPTDPTPSADQLNRLAYSYSLNNGGIPVTCRVTAYRWRGPWALMPSDDEVGSMAGLNSDNTVGTDQSQYTWTQ